LIREITTGGVVSTLAGQAGVTGVNNSPATAASFNIPWGVAADSDGNVYVADYGNSLIRKITP
jgi:DNA-binding beta-propeller fold protein YncE